nr:hypothetical protein Q903MT_gene4863 [Picea sitchensis]
MTCSQESTCLNNNARLIPRFHIPNRPMPTKGYILRNTPSQMLFDRPELPNNLDACSPHLVP